MRIHRLTAHDVRIPLKRTIRHASHSRDATDSLIVRCELTDGSVGWGEGLPREYVTGETIDAAWQLLEHPDLIAPLDVAFDSPTDAVAALDAFLVEDASRFDLTAEISHRRSQISNFKSEIAATETPQHKFSAPDVSTSHLARGCFGNSVRCAIELAVLDAVCRSARVPLSHVTTLLSEAEPLRQQVSEVQYSGVITAERPLQQLHAALKQRVYGFRQIKVKVGTAGSDDVAALRRIRRIVGRRIDLRIDANEAWSCDELHDRLAPLTGLGISSVEQPVPHAEVAGLAKLRSELSVPIMLDESLCSAADGRRAIDEKLCDLFNVRLSKCGGYLPSLRLAMMAHEAGLGYQLGCQVGETGILSAAGRHFATSVAGIRYLEGSYDRHLVRQSLTQEDVTFGYGGRAPALTGPGLGITVDTDAVQRVTLRSHEIIPE